MNTKNEDKSGRKFHIEIVETCSRIVEIEAESDEDALIAVKRKYRDGEIILDSNDYLDTDFKICPELH